MRLIEQRRKLVESEARQLGLMDQYITTEPMMTLVNAVVSTVREHVHDQETLNAIAVGIESVMGVEP